MATLSSLKTLVSFFGAGGGLCDARDACFGEGDGVRSPSFSIDSDMPPSAGFRAPFRRLLYATPPLAVSPTFVVTSAFRINRFGCTHVLCGIDSDLEMYLQTLAIPRTSPKNTQRFIPRRPRGRALFVADGPYPESMPACSMSQTQVHYAEKYGENAVETARIISKISLTHSTGAVSSTVYAVGWILLSASIIVCNKILYTGGFPFPVILTATHVTAVRLTTSCLAAATTVRPINPKERNFKFLPLAVLYALSLALSNTAYLFLDISEAQMLKCAMPAFSYGFTNLALKNQASADKNYSLVLVVFGVAVATYTNNSINGVGAALQLLAMLAEACRLAFSQKVMQVENEFEEPYTVIETLHHVSLPTAVLLVATALVVDVPRAIDTAVRLDAGVACLSVALAMALNCAAYKLVQQQSAVVLCLAGVVKDIMLIAFSYIFFNSAVSWLQTLGYAIAVAGVARYKFPTEFSAGVTIMQRNGLLVMYAIIIIAVGWLCWSKVPLLVNLIQNEHRLPCTLGAGYTKALCMPVDMLQLPVEYDASSDVHVVRDVHVWSHRFWNADYTFSEKNTCFDTKSSTAPAVSVRLRRAIKLNVKHTNNFAHGIFEEVARLLYVPSHILHNNTLLVEGTTVPRVVHKLFPDAKFDILNVHARRVLVDKLTVPKAVPCGRANCETVFWMRDVVFSLKRKTLAKRVILYKRTAETTITGGYLLNHEEVLSLCVDVFEGWDVVSLSPTWEDRNLFTDAALLVGPHGAGLVNSLFMQKDAAVVEIKGANMHESVRHFEDVGACLNRTHVVAPMNTNVLPEKLTMRTSGFADMYFLNKTLRLLKGDLDLRIAGAQ